MGAAKVIGTVRLAAVQIQSHARRSHVRVEKRDDDVGPDGKVRPDCMAIDPGTARPVRRKSRSAEASALLMRWARGADRRADAHHKDMPGKRRQARSRHAP